MASNKRRPSEEENDSPSKRSRGEMRCNYCKHVCELLPGKLFCAACALNASECYKCHRPLPHHRVENHICITCRNKQNKSTYQTGLGGLAKSSSLPLVSVVDPLVSMTGARSDVREELSAR